MSEIFTSRKMPVLALRGIAVFPEQTVHFDIGRVKSAMALENAMKHDQILMLIPQKDILVDDPNLSDLFTIGTVVKVKQILKSQSDNIRVLVSGLYRAKVDCLTQQEPFMSGIVEPVQEGSDPDSLRSRALRREANMLYGAYIDMVDHPPQGVQLRIMASDRCGFVADSIAQNASFDYRDKAKLLCQLNPVRRLESTLHFLRQEVQMIQLETDIQEKTRAKIDQNQRDYYLREQMNAIRDELGEADDYSEFAEYEKGILLLNLPEETETKLLKDLQRLRKQPFGSAEASVLRNYLDTVLELPWNKTTKERVDISAASKILEKDHFGMEKVKERIIEHLAVLKMRGDFKSPIICLYGPPGVGKTSLGKSIAKAMKRKYVRMSLGGLHDEAEIRGHRKTYVGAMAGQIIKNIKKAGSSNPVFILDEIDKVTQNTNHGDPASALLEVLDPEQNFAFHDNYLDADYDLSKVMFIATANNINTIPGPLLDRMELIEVSGYLTEEKVEIAKRHLVPQELDNLGMKDSGVKLSKAAIEKIIEDYTRESGVRDLNKKINKVLRKVTLKYAKEGVLPEKSLNVDDIKEHLGTEPYSRDKYQGNDYYGVVTGLAWTSVGGEILFIETSIDNGKGGKLGLTGNLGDVMKESATIALQYMKEHCDELGFSSDFFENHNIHIHVPEGATPKDGPSAGITIATSLASAITKRKVRKNIAMTGEITLRGKVLPVGGIKEKILAAKRAGITDIIICKENRKNIEDIPEKYVKGVNFHYVENVKDVLDFALL